MMSVCPGCDLPLRSLAALNVIEHEAVRGDQPPLMVYDTICARCRMVLRRQPKLAS